MKKTLVTLALGMACNSAFAADETGPLNFYGNIYGGGTCPIEVVDPRSGVIPKVSLGNFTNKYFTTSGTATPDVAFALRVTPGDGCVIPPDAKTTVTYVPLSGIVGTNLYGIRRGPVTGLGVAIKDRNHTKVVPNVASIEYDLYESLPTDMIFHASYESFEDEVTGQGLAEAEVTFVVSLP
ncbi:fimbrial protein [Pseudomonas alkylphenolica]|uniref:fimbrial protein n=1 Tax=Pseudomonas alkylphenolica TaxID=237609 RepID=UPI0018D9B99B|nr:fimbrial protein [Pseudomonas alkylphenolica]MBH3430262.1 type 1 fimbrial protein [Pseudomonas alkylphenolica]